MKDKENESKEKERQLEFNVEPRQLSQRNS
jgi:hypothetical protein